MFQIGQENLLIFAESQTHKIVLKKGPYMTLTCLLMVVAMLLPPPCTWDVFKKTFERHAIKDGNAGI